LECSGHFFSRHRWLLFSRGDLHQSYLQPIYDRLDRAQNPGMATGWTTNIVFRMTPSGSAIRSVIVPEPFGDGSAVGWICCRCLSLALFSFSSLLFPATPAGSESFHRPNADCRTNPLDPMVAACPFASRVPTSALFFFCRMSRICARP